MSTRVYVGGLNHRSREKDVERFFRKFGRIREISIKVSGKVSSFYQPKNNVISARSFLHYLTRVLSFFRTDFVSSNSTTTGMPMMHVTK